MDNRADSYNTKQKFSYRLFHSYFKQNPNFINKWFKFFFWGFFPLLVRFRRGEGALLAINCSIILAYETNFSRILIQFFVSFATLAILYLFNDLHDAEYDLVNPKKNQDLVQFFLKNKRVLYFIMSLQTLFIFFIAFFYLSKFSAVSVFSVIIINTLYSCLIKGIPVLDIVWVGLWGSLYAILPGNILSLQSLILIGSMTSISHIFQIWEDRAVDCVNNTKTTIVFSPNMFILLFFICCGINFYVLSLNYTFLLSSTAFLPLIIHLFFPSPQKGWILSKIYFSVIWIFWLVNNYAF